MKPLRRRPSQKRSRETVDVVFEAALRELQRGDPTAVNVNRVAETAGVSIGSIYQYFPSKETLLSSLIAHYMRRRFEAIMALIRAIQEEERATQTQVPLEEVMRRLVHGTIRLKQKGLPLEFALISWFARVGSLASLTELDREYTQAMAEALRTLQQPPARIRSVDPQLAARILMQSIRAILLTAILQEPGLVDSEALCDEVTKLAVGYLKPE